MPVHLLILLFHLKTTGLWLSFGSSERLVQMMAQSRVGPAVGLAAHASAMDGHLRKDPSTRPLLRPDSEKKWEEHFLQKKEEDGEDDAGGSGSAHSEQVNQLTSSPGRGVGSGERESIWTQDARYSSNAHQIDRVSFARFAGEHVGSNVGRSGLVPPSGARLQSVENIELRAFALAIFVSTPHRIYGSRSRQQAAAAQHWSRSSGCSQTFARDDIDDGAAHPTWRRSPAAPRREGSARLPGTAVAARGGVGAASAGPGAALPVPPPAKAAKEVRAGGVPLQAGQQPMRSPRCFTQAYLRFLMRELVHQGNERALLFKMPLFWRFVGELLWAATHTAGALAEKAPSSAALIDLGKTRCDPVAALLCFESDTTWDAFLGGWTTVCRSAGDATVPRTVRHFVGVLRAKCRAPGDCAQFSALMAEALDFDLSRGYEWRVRNEEVIAAANAAAATRTEDPADTAQRQAKASPRTRRRAALRRRRHLKPTKPGPKESTDARERDTQAQVGSLFTQSWWLISLVSVLVLLLAASRVFLLRDGDAGGVAPIAGLCEYTEERVTGGAVSDVHDSATSTNSLRSFAGERCKLTLTNSSGPGGHSHATAADFEAVRAATSTYDCTVKGAVSERMVRLAARAISIPTGSSASYDAKINDTETLGATLLGTAVDGSSCVSRGIVPITLTDFIAIKDSTTTSVVAYGTAKGTPKWGNSGGGGIQGNMCAKEVDSIQNVTSITGFDPVAAFGNFFCSLFSKETPCALFANEVTDHEICEWNATTSSCETKSGVNICYLVSVRASSRFVSHEFTRTSSWPCALPL